MSHHFHWFCCFGCGMTLLLSLTAVILLIFGITFYCETLHRSPAMSAISAPKKAAVVVAESPEPEPASAAAAAATPMRAYYRLPGRPIYPTAYLSLKS